jgi:hypothetical protein
MRTDADCAAWIKIDLDVRYPPLKTYRSGATLPASGDWPEAGTQVSAAKKHAKTTLRKMASS